MALTMPLLMVTRGALSGSIGAQPAVVAACAGAAWKAIEATAKTDNGGNVKGENIEIFHA